MKLMIAGGGMIVQYAAPSLAQWGWEVTAICVTPRGAERAAALAEKCGQPRIYTDYAEMLDRKEADTVYIAVPNHLHFSMAKGALERGCNVILEKPMTSNIEELRVLVALAKEKRLFLYEAITTLYQPNYVKLRELLPQVGRVKLVSCNFSQYSSRYNGFREGKLAPVFDVNQSGGALMDLNLYNLHWIMGLFGVPEAAGYAPNVERGIDTSGVLTLRYPGFQAVSLGAKDCAAPCRSIIQGTDGYLIQDAPANACGAILLHRNDGREERFDSPVEHRLEKEFRTFLEQIERGALDRCYQTLEHSVAVMEVLTQVRRKAGIRFPADELFDH